MKRPIPIGKFRTYREYLKDRFSEYEKVRKFCLSGGFTCPNRDGKKGRGGCLYCDNRSFSQVIVSGREAIRKQVQKHFSKAQHKDGLGWVAYFQPFSNTYAPVEELEAMYREALEHSEVLGINIGTRPDCVPFEVVGLLDRLSVEAKLTLELGLESGHDRTLSLLNRKHDLADFVDAMDRCSARDFHLCVHVMIGLPGEGPLEVRETAELLGRWKIDLVKIHPVHVVSGTGLEKMWKAGDYALLERADYVSQVADFMEYLSPEITVERFSAVVDEEFLCGPFWVGEVNVLRRDIEVELEKREARQGSRFRSKMSKS